MQFIYMNNLRGMLFVFQYFYPFIQHTIEMIIRVKEERANARW